MFNWIKPKENLEQSETDRGLRMLLFDATCSQILGVFTGGAFLVAFALLLGASNRVIGLLAAVGPLAQTLQIPTIFLIDSTRRRKALVVGLAFLGRIAWFSIALIPWLVPRPFQLNMFLGLLFWFFAFGSMSGCAFNSWMRDFIPENILGKFSARRLTIAIGLSTVLGLLAGIGVDFYKRNFGNEIAVYSLLFVFGAIAGLLGLIFLAKTPEPLMNAERSKGILRMLGEPFRCKNFRGLLGFLASWNFAVNLAAPFFTVYMLRRLGLEMAWIIALSVVSQTFNVLFLRVWGRMADSFSNKSVLAVSGPLFLVSIALWPFTTLPDVYALTIPLVIAIHALTGMSTAGVTLCTANIALKSAPRGEAAAYLATNALISGLAATLAPIIGGSLADWFSTKELSLMLQWSSTSGEGSGFTMSAMNLRGLDFLFIGAVLAGLHALHRLSLIKEEGEVEEEIVKEELVSEMKKAVRNVANVGGLRDMVYFPYNLLKDTVGRATRATAEKAPTKTVS